MLTWHFIPAPRKFGGNVLDFSIQPTTTDLHHGHPNTSPTCSITKFYTSPAYGCYNEDAASPQYNYQWNSLKDMEIWLRREQESKSIELQWKDTVLGTDGKWTQCLIFVCAHQGTRGKSQYKKKHPEHYRKLPSKWIGCSCQLWVKCYPGMEKVLRKYEEGHSHPIGDRNIKHTRLSEETHLQMVEMVQLGFTYQKCCLPQR